MVNQPPSHPRRPNRRMPSKPDAALARGPGVEYRYTLTLSNPNDARGIFQLASEMGTAVRYLLLVQEGEHGQYRAYLGLGSADLYDLPLRLAARGIQIERGEQINSEPADEVIGLASVRRR